MALNKIRRRTLLLSPALWSALNPEPGPEALGFSRPPVRRAAWAVAAALVRCWKTPEFKKEKDAILLTFNRVALRPPGLDRTWGYGPHSRIRCWSFCEAGRSRRSRRAKGVAGLFPICKCMQYHMRRSTYIQAAASSAKASRSPPSISKSVRKLHAVALFGMLWHIYGAF
ncbi:hypothetical protein FIBSPDRAFT_284421 [Athelia psychrophila]|uniref:Uncharacterized protein n=1 Tax=Athelia psychrophila TaxID=1759441 RepID=A0A166R5H3_9AGAM|nr:hypothetical protein FIBSPDRAFT_284421 [Fibularhizoctonia sp. CBS 109695]